MRSLTRDLFARELESMVEETPFERVRVAELCRRCGATPQAFYYHFHDKYDLAACIFLSDVGESGALGSLEQLTAILERMWERRSFYVSALSEHTQNSLGEYLTAFYIRMAGEMIDKGKILALWYDAYGSVSMISKWLRGEFDVSASELATFLHAKTPDFMVKRCKEEPDEIKALFDEAHRRA